MIHFLYIIFAAGEIKMHSARFLIPFVAFTISLGACAKDEAEPAAAGTDKATAVHAAETAARSMDERMAAGEKLFSAHCAACHQANGQGLAGAFPPLAESDFLNEGVGPAIDAVINGLSGPITVNGVDYNAVMPNLAYLKDEEVADILTFVMNSWGNPGGEVSSGEVAAARGG